MSRNLHHENAIQQMKLLAEDPQLHTEEATLAIIQVNATLALAYEQRTANLLALHAALQSNQEYYSAKGVLTKINERLGLK